MNALFNQLIPALCVEFQKVRRSKTLWLTVLAFVLAVIIGGLFMYILKDPERARQLGIIGAKAQIFGGTADWPSFFNLMFLLVSIGGLIIFGFIFVWIFGREYSDKAYYDMLSLPTSRVVIVIAKIITAAYWSMALVLIVFIFMLGIGAVLQLPGWSSATTMHGLALLLGTGALTILGCIPFGLMASITRGYLPAVGGMFLVLVLGQIINQIGYGQYFPWNIPMMYSGAAQALSGKTAAPLGFVSYFLVLLVGIISIIVTGAWWRYADQT
jgi:ABC-2 type transport system permease protein